MEGRRWARGDGRVLMEIVFGKVADLDGLRALWLELHHHHLRIASYPVPTSDEQSWQVRRGIYQAALDAESGFLLVANDGPARIGYAMTLLHPGGPNDTFVLRSTYAELYTLVVASSHRALGTGSRLFSAVEHELQRRDVTELEIAVMANNTQAVRFYERRGATPVETMMWKFKDVGRAVVIADHHSQTSKPESANQ